MNPASAAVRRTYLTLQLLTTLATSLIWGVNTLFLLDAGLSNFEAFAANAFFTAGMMAFEVPTGVVADLRGRRLSFLLGASTLCAMTLLYVWMWHVHADFVWWALVSVGLGLGFTFFSGAVEAWLVDALTSTGYEGELDAVFGNGQAVQGAAMLVGSVGGGLLAQAGSLGLPFVARAVLLALTFVVAWVAMHDLGFEPEVGKSPRAEVGRIWHDSLEQGLGQRPVRWVMLTSPFIGGVNVYAFYAMQPYLLQLYGSRTAYGIAGLAAAIVAGAQVVGGLLGPRMRRLVHRRTSWLLLALATSTVALAAVGLVDSFAGVVVLLVAWSFGFAAAVPVRQAYLNGLIPSRQRATVLSFDSLLGSAGGVVLQPGLGRLADLSGYAPTFLLSAAFQALALPLLGLARRERAVTDVVVREAEPHAG
ncbi:MFS transporter [Phycicoccus sp. M110.8]|uniref:MFS transporter n=1 Tax=Phycicoccus sp. M110.8 TaxID=3075433 RepID=UPI0028FDAF83|nr:MFS transporter [Phycicoccus sp. M110.8]MDU0314327.1 MFS transporter [Phycicoccus sp. M110.8]